MTSRSPDRHEAAQLAGFRSSERYLAQGDLDPGFFPLLLALTWIQREPYQHQRERRIHLGAVDASPRSGSCAATYVEILAGGGNRPLGRWSERP